MDKMRGIRMGGGPVSCSLPERNVRGMGWPWVVDSGPDQGILSKQGVCRFPCVFHNKET